MICHTVGVAVKESEISPLYSFFKMGENIFIALKNHNKYYNKFSGGILLIPQSIQNIPWW